MTSNTPTPARPALDASLAKVKAFMAFDSFPAGETTSPTFEALRVVIDDYDRVVRSLADMRGALKDVQADLIAYMLIHAADYASAGPSVEQYKEMIANLQSALARSAP